MKVQRIKNDISEFKSFKINIEVSVESREDQELLLKLGHIAHDLCLSDGEGNSTSSFITMSSKDAENADSLIRDILSNLHGIN